MSLILLGLVHKAAETADTYIQLLLQTIQGL